MDGSKWKDILLGRVRMSLKIDIDLRFSADYGLPVVVATRQCENLYLKQSLCNEGFYRIDKPLHIGLLLQGCCAPLVTLA